MARRYSKGASKDVASAMRRRKKGSLKSGGSGKTVKSRTQAIAEDAPAGTTRTYRSSKD
jgi:hypothetical protein